jgi:hypothetical protein
VPSVASLDALHRAVAEFAVTDLDLVIVPPALAAARQSLDSSGLLLLGEIHGVRENPLLIHALMKAFGLTSLALEWPEDLTPMIRAFLASGTLAGHPWLWGRDGRIPPATWRCWPTAGTDLVRRGHRRGLELVPAR